MTCESTLIGDTITLTRDSAVEDIWLCGLKVYGREPSNTQLIEEYQVEI